MHKPSSHPNTSAYRVTRRAMLQAVAAGAAASALPSELRAALERPEKIVAPDWRFPYFQSSPVSYFNVTLQDAFWAPRQKVVREVTVPWATGHLDESGGLSAYQPGYQAKLSDGDFEAVKFIEAMAAVVGLQRDAAIEGLTEAWGAQILPAQGADGYWWWGWPASKDPSKRWQAVWGSHEDYAIGHYLESGLALRESTGSHAIFDSALKAVDNMAATMLVKKPAYAPGHAQIEQALMRLYGSTGDSRYLKLCGWLIGQRGHHDGRRSFLRYSQDHAPIEEQRTIEGHAVRAGFLFNGVTQYVGATGHAGYREAVIEIWDDFVKHKMYVHGAGGQRSAQNEGYGTQPDSIPPADCYGESCSVVANFHWAHNLFSLTGDAKYLDVAERMLYNAFYASLSLEGDRYFYHNVIKKDEPGVRFAWHSVPCCPPNIVKLFSKVGGFFYSVGDRGVYIKHYGTSTAQIPLAKGIRIVQKANYPWSGDFLIEVQPRTPTEFTLRLRKPAWAKSHSLAVNGKPVDIAVDKGWLAIHRKWTAGDRVELSLAMQIERIKMPPRFKDYAGFVAIERGPLVYCLEGMDVSAAVQAVYVPPETKFTTEHRPELLGGVTILKAKLPRQNIHVQTSSLVDAQLIPYGLWNNRTPSLMRVWLRDYEIDIATALPRDPPA